jgi:hypothetical protein
MVGNKSIAILFLLPKLCFGEIVIAEGRAESASQSSKEQALTDALREAVRKGAGVNLSSQTKNSNLTLDYDRVFAAAFGYVQGYQVLECGVKGDGFYHVKISADVAKGDPNTNDKVALKQLIALKNSPIIAFDIKEAITFVPKNSGYAQSWFQEQANQMQLHVVELEANQRNELIFAQGDSKSPAKTKSSQQKVDFLIRGRVEGKYQVFESGDDTPFSIAASFEAVCPATGEIIATVNLSPNGKIKTKIESPQLAAKNIIEKCLHGSEGGGDEGASVLFRRIFARWAADLDLGRKVRLEIAEINDKSLRIFLEKLRENDKIHAINKREFDAKGVTSVDLETRLNSDELIKLLTESSNSDYIVEYATESVIFLNRDDTPQWKKQFKSILNLMGL